MSVIATVNANPPSFESRHVFIHNLASSSYNYCLSDIQLFCSRYLYYEHNLTIEIKSRIKVILFVSFQHISHVIHVIVLTLVNKNNNKKNEIEGNVEEETNSLIQRSKRFVYLPNYL
jgi:hypothetical protein